MRKLVYVATKGNVNIELTTYKEAQEAKAQGFTVKEKLIDYVERLYYNRVNEKGEILETTTLTSVAYNWKKNGAKVVSEIRWVES